jgi:GTP cyclohydrolase II
MLNPPMKSRPDRIVEELVRTRLPIRQGQFTLHCYRSALDHRDHVALVRGEVCGASDVLVRVHSECLTGDVFGSTRCDCGEQLELALDRIGGAECGVLIYLRQEGRGIGLIQKLRAYNLQDEGLDTVEANLRLGHGADERDYAVAALMLQDLEVRSVRLMTNNPQKIQDLERDGIVVSERVPIEIPHQGENLRYLRTKASKMAHLLSLGQQSTDLQEYRFLDPLLRRLAERRGVRDAAERPFITLSYAQSLDGSIAVEANAACALSGPQSIRLTHYLRSRHDALLVGVNTILSDNPRLSVRHCPGNDPQPVILDSHLRMPEDCALLAGTGTPPIILTTEGVEGESKAMRLRGRARIFAVPSDAEGYLDLAAALRCIADLGLKTVMVEGGAQVITRFLCSGFVDCVITVTSRMIGGVRAVGPLHQDASGRATGVIGCRYQVLGDDLIAYGDYGVIE